MQFFEDVHGITYPVSVIRQISRPRQREAPAHQTKDVRSVWLEGHDDPVQISERQFDTLIAAPQQVLAAPSGTFIVYAFKDGSHHKVPVVLWGLPDHGVPVPYTLTGTTEESTNRNRFILHPDGTCSDYDQSWASLDEAIEEMKQYDDSPDLTSDPAHSPPSE
jgi:hypothetical protein